MGTIKAKPSMWLWLMRGGNLGGQASTTSEDPKNRWRVLGIAKTKLLGYIA